MSKFEKQLKACPYCGGKAEFKSVKTKKRITAGTLQERYIGHEGLKEKEKADKSYFHEDGRISERFRHKIKKSPV